MPIYMDRHYMEGVTRHVLATAHSKDLQTQGKYGVRFITYWFDEVRSTAFCLVDAPNKDAIQRAHDEAHGDVPSEIIEVDPAVVEAFLGRVTDLAPSEERRTSTAGCGCARHHVYRSAGLDGNDQATWATRRRCICSVCTML